MRKGGKKRNIWNPKWNKNLLIVLFIVLIVVVAYIYISNLKSENYISVREAINNSQYRNTNVTIRGYYSSHGGGYIVARDSSDINPGESISLNHSAVNKTLGDGIKYDFTGFLQYDEVTTAYMLYATKIERS